MQFARRRQAGFTLIEVMIVVAILAILTMVAVPMFFSESRRAKSNAEVPPMFNDLRMRIEQYRQENGVYPVSLGEGTTWPTAPSSSLQPLLPMPQAWTDLKVRPSGGSSVYCGYTWVTGLANDASNIGTQAAAMGFVVPPTDWYYLLAHCDLDDSPTLDGYYLSSSVDPTIVKVNEGH
ncbi:MAG TPA: type II secretion system protein [Kofleriaceae bacterium]|jgi:prepilin-type N-terminal cleavage/methylation domain-containing protein